MDEILKRLANEIDMIQEPETKDFTIAAIKLSPVKYWHRPSAQTPGHHPDDEHAEWGNLLHVKRTVRIVFDLAETAGTPPIIRDLLISGMLIHDIGKYGINGDNEKIGPEHPFLVKYMITSLHDFELFDEVIGIVESHMGRWGDRPPQTGLEILGHCADYLASRRYMNIEV